MMKIAYIIFDGITWLDFIGIYDPVSRLKSLQYMPGLSWDICSFTDVSADNFGLEMKSTKIKQTLEHYDVLFVPGGHGTRKLQHDINFIDWIKTAANAKLKLAVCTGSLILGAAGFLKDRKATTHFSEYESLKPYCRTVLTDRIVEDDGVITAGAVSASLDLGLYLCNKWAGAEAEKEIRKKMNYYYQEGSPK